MTELSLRGLISPFSLASPTVQLTRVEAIRADRLIRKESPKKKAKKASAPRAKRLPRGQANQLAAVLKNIKSMTPEELNALKKEFTG